MHRFVPKSYGSAGPEAKIQAQIVTMLENKGWFVMVSHGNMFQKGWPDLYATHYQYRARWIEVKLPGMVGSRFTPAQIETFPELCKHGSGVWILTAPTEEEYQKLFQKWNWTKYLPYSVSKGLKS